MAASGEQWQASQGAIRPVGVLSALAAVAGVALLAATVPPAWGAVVTGGVAGLLLLAMWRLQWPSARGSARWTDLELLEALDSGEPVGPPAPPRDKAMPALEHFDPALADRSPWRELEWDDVLSRLRSQSDAWRQARTVQAGRAQRLRHLEWAVTLLEHGIPLGGGQVPDLAAMRAEAFLLRADPGPAVLREMAGLQARRLQLAIAAADGRDGAALQAHWTLLQQLFDLMPGALRLRELAWRVQRLAWNPGANLEQVDIAYVQAAEYRLLLEDWWARAAAVTLADGGTLEMQLLARCPALQPRDGDDVARVEAAQDLWPAFQQQVDESLAHLAAVADRLEARGGARADAPSAQSSVG